LRLCGEAEANRDEVAERATLKTASCSTGASLGRLLEAVGREERGASAEERGAGFPEVLATSVVIKCLWTNARHLWRESSEGQASMERMLTDDFPPRGKDTVNIMSSLAFLIFMPWILSISKGIGTMLGS
jgi:hypothetical protein